MTKRFFTLLAVAVLVIAPASIRAQSVSLAGGLSQPNGDLSDGVGSGYSAALGFNFGAPLIPLGARIEGGINGFNYKGGASGSVRIMNVTANGIFKLGMPYMIGGLGYYDRQIKETVVGTQVSETQRALGFNVGGGVSLPLGMLSPFAEIRYHAMLGDKDKAANFQFIPITFGVKF